MRVLMTGGGTGGHINPALAIAAIIKERYPDAEFLFVGARGRMEETLVPAAGYTLKTVEVSGFQRRLTLKNIGRNVKAAVCAVTASAACGRILKEFRPDIAIGTGGYVSGPVLRRAAQMGIPVAVHESNAFPGVTVKMLAKYADVVMICDEAARKYLPAAAKVAVTGNPVHADFTGIDRETARRELGLDERPMVLSVGGSLGARRINETMTAVLARSHREGGLQHIHATGRREYETVCKALGEAGVPLHADGIWVRDYIDDMPRCMAAADVVISRCGAMTLSELPIAGKPAILIPSPNVAENHQYHNAMALVNKGAALCIEEKDLTEQTLWEALEQVLSHPEVCREMAENARRAAITDVDARIWQAIAPLIEKKEK